MVVDGLVISRSNGGNTDLQLTDGGVDSAADEILNQFQANEACPDYDGIRHPRVQSRNDAIDILQIAKRKDAGQIDAGDIGADRCGSRGENELVVRLFVIFASVEVANPHSLSAAIDRFDRGAGADIEIETLGELAAA